MVIAADFFDMIARQVQMAVAARFFQLVARDHQMPVFADPQQAAAE